MSVSTDPPGRSTNAQIADAITRIVRRLSGRGPVSCRVIVDGDVVVALLHETLTKGETTLIENGHEEEVQDFRRAFQQVARPSFVDAVERITGRRVETFMSTNHAVPDRAAEIFLLGDPVEAD